MGINSFELSVLFGQQKQFEYFIFRTFHEVFGLIGKMHWGIVFFFFFTIEV